MALSIKSDEADRLARELARLTGESLTDAVTESLRERLAREERRRRRRPGDVIDALRELREHVASLPVYDTRTPDEIIGYDEHGLPT